MPSSSTQQNKARPTANKHAATPSHGPLTRAGQPGPRGRSLMLAEARAYLAEHDSHDSREARLIAELADALEPNQQVMPAAEPKRVEQRNDKFMEGMAAQAVERRKEEIASGKLLSATTLATRLSLTTQAVSAAVRADRMFVLNGPSGEGYFPAFFADEKYPRRALEKVSKALGKLPGASKWEFFRTPRISLNGKTPLEALSKGQVDSVLWAAVALLDE
jgi:hypothetical protein